MKNRKNDSSSYGERDVIVFANTADFSNELRSKNKKPVLETEYETELETLRAMVAVAAVVGIDFIIYRRPRKVLCPR